MANFIGKAIHHPGRMKKLAKAHGRSVHAEMEHDKHSKSPSLRAAANLGLRLTGGDLHKSGPKPDHIFAHGRPRS